MTRPWTEEWALKEGIRLAGGVINDELNVAVAASRIDLMAQYTGMRLELDDSVSLFYSISWDVDEIKEKYGDSSNTQAMEREIEALGQWHLKHNEPKKAAKALIEKFEKRLQELALDEEE